MNSGKLEELTATNEKIGVAEIHTEMIEDYQDFIVNIFKESISSHLSPDFVVGIDTANGATYQVAEKIFSALGISYQIINNTPTGVNINENCGSTHLEEMKQFVRENHLSLGIAYDGDGDRCLAIDETGNVIDGDILLATISTYLKERGKLNKDTVVATVMSNLGLKKYIEENDMTLLQTKVGDRYVLEEMLKNSYSLGGEQSGHIIFSC